MSLDVSLKSVGETGSCSACAGTGKATEIVFESSITHNLAPMADAAGIYYKLWRPETLNVTRASQLIEPLAAGLARLRERPEHFRQYNPSNGWGRCEDLIRFVEQYLEACREHPDAIVSTDR